MPLGLPELKVIFFVLILLLFGAKRIPELARGIGRSLGEVKKAKSDLESEFSLNAKPDMESVGKTAEERRGGKA